MAKNKGTKGSAARISKSEDGVKPPSMPTETVDPSTLEVTDPRRKLSKDEWRALSPEQKKTRRAAVRAGRAPVKDRLSKAVGKIARRTERLAKIFSTEPSLHEAFVNTARVLRAVSGEIGELNGDWKPTKVAGRGEPREAKFREGAIVRLVEKHRPQYEGLIEVDEMTGLRVDKVQGKNVRVVTESGVKMFLPANRLEADGTQG